MIIPEHKAKIVEILDTLEKKCFSYACENGIITQSSNETYNKRNSRKLFKYSNCKQLLELIYDDEKPYASKTGVEKAFTFFLGVIGSNVNYQSFDILGELFQSKNRIYVAVDLTNIFLNIIGCNPSDYNDFNLLLIEFLRKEKQSNHL